jgi:hypothetical protein
MARFYSSSNNGVVAVISDEHARLYGLILKAEGKPTLAGCRVFTFCSENRIERDPLQKMVMTGTHSYLNFLLQAGGHEIIEGESVGWDGYVPFSNGYASEARGYEAKDPELLYLTTLGDVIAAFGISTVIGQ